MIESLQDNVQSLSDQKESLEVCIEAFSRSRTSLSLTIERAAWRKNGKRILNESKHVVTAEVQTYARGAFFFDALVFV